MIKDTDLVAIDIESEATSFDSLLSEVKKVGRVEVVAFDNKSFRASVTGQKGSISYVVRTSDGVSLQEGADTIAKLILFSKLPLQVAKDKAGQFKTSENFVKLRAALRRQKTREAKKQS